MNILGKRVRDKITGFEGIVIGRIEYLFGCAQYCICPRADNNVLKDAEWFDKGRVEILSEGVTPQEVRAEQPGGDSSIAPKIH